MELVIMDRGVLKHMEVIKHGNTYKEVECRICGALLSYCKKDVKEESGYNDDYFGRLCYSTTKYVECPECDSRVILG